MRASHIAWISQHGEVPAGMYVLHRCDNPECSRPDHLFLGTQGDNMRDRASKHRDKLANGMHFNSKVTPEQVRSIRAKWPTTSAVALGKEFGITPTTAWGIAVGKNHRGVI